MAANVLATPALFMTMTDIAECAGVQRPVVTNWRRRHRDFPRPAGGDQSRPRFDPNEVADWLLATDRITTERAEQELVLFQLRGLAARYDGPDVMAAVTTLLCLRFLAGENDPLCDNAADPVAAVRSLARVKDPHDRMLRTEIHAMPPTAGWLVRLVDNLVQASWTCKDAFERVMDARHRFGAGALTAVTVTPALARLVAELSGAAERARRGRQLLAADPAAGPGDLLVAVARVLGPDSPPSVAAVEANPALARLLRRRMIVHGVSERDVRIHSALSDESADPDVIVTQIPYQPGEARDISAVLNAVDDVAVSLSPGRFGVVVGPAAVLTGELPPHSDEQRARAKFLTDDVVEAIINLPGGLVPFRPGYETAIWVLTQARDSRWRGRVLLADLSDRELTDQVVHDIVEDVVTWRREGYQPSAHYRVFSQQVAVDNLINPPRALTIGSRPSSEQERKRDGARRVNVVTQCGVDLNRIGATASADRMHVTTEVVTAADYRPRIATIGTLIQDKRLLLRQGSRIKPEHITPSGHHVVLGIDEVLGRRRPGQRLVDREVFAREYPSARLTEPGDILVGTVIRPGVLVDTHGYAIAEYPVQILRIPATEPRRFTNRVLAALLFADGSGSRVSGAVRAGRALEEQRVILLPPAQARALDRLLAGIDARRDLARRELNVLDELQQATIGGLINGTLTLISDEAHGQDQ